MSTQTTELRQLSNTVSIIGTLKSKDLEIRQSKKNENYVSGKITVLVKRGKQINEIPVRVFMMEKSKLFKGIKTVMDEYKAVDEVGLDEADRIRVTGEIALNEYFGQDGSLRSFNEVKGIFFNRTEDDQEDTAMATVETVVRGFEPEIKDGFPTGRQRVKCFTVGWGNTVTEFLNTYVSEELFEAFENLYPVNSTGELSFQLNNYVEETEAESAAATVSHGFGSTEKVEDKTIKNYVNEYVVIGGDMPQMEPKAYSEEEVEAALTARERTLQELEQSASAPSTPAAHTGFGGAGSSAPTASAASTPQGDNSGVPNF